MPVCTGWRRRLRPHSRGRSGRRGVSRPQRVRRRLRPHFRGRSGRRGVGRPQRRCWRRLCWQSRVRRGGAGRNRPSIFWRATARRRTPVPTATATAPLRTPSRSTTSGWSRWSSRRRGRCPTTPPSSSRRGPEPTCCREKWTRCAAIWTGAASCCCCWTRRTPRASRPRRVCSASCASGASKRATTSWSTQAAWVGCSAPTPRCRWPRTIRSTRSPNGSIC